MGTVFAYQGGGWCVAFGVSRVWYWSWEASIEALLVGAKRKVSLRMVLFLVAENYTLVS
jgi:hypothetical protein